MNKLKLFWGMVITLAFMLVLAGCSGDSTNSSSTAGRSNVSRDTVYEFYDKVKLNQTKEQAESIPNGATYDEVKNILGGEGTETSATQIPFEDNKVSYIRVWVNQDGTMLQAVFLTDGTTNNVMYFN